MHKETFTEDEQRMLMNEGWELNETNTRASKDWRRMSRYGDRIVVDIWEDDWENGGGWWLEDAVYRSVGDALNVAGRLSS
jgi:hypothetical protein